MSVYEQVSVYVCLFIADQNKDRREVVRRKTSEYLVYAENLQEKLRLPSSVKTNAATSNQVGRVEYHMVVM